MKRLWLVSLGLGVVVGATAWSSPWSHFQRVAASQKVQISVQQPSCQEVTTGFERLQSESREAHRSIVQKIKEMSFELYELHQTYQPWEGQTIEVPIGAYDILRERSEAAIELSEGVYNWMQIFDEQSMQLMEGLQACLSGLPVASDLAARLEDYNINARENERLAAEVVSEIARRLDEWHNQWGPQEGHQHHFSEGDFSEIFASADLTSEAGPLIEDLTALWDSHLTSIIADFKKVAPQATERR